MQLLPQLLLEEEEKMLLLLLHQLPRPPAPRPPRPPAGAFPALWYVAFGGGPLPTRVLPPLPLRSIFLSLREVNGTCRRRIRLRDNKSIFRRNWQLAISHIRSLTTPAPRRLALPIIPFQLRKWRCDGDYVFSRLKRPDFLQRVKVLK